MPNCISSPFSFSVSPARETPARPRTLNCGPIHFFSDANRPRSFTFRASSATNDAAKRIPDSGPQERRIYGELGFKEKRDEQLNFERTPDERIGGKYDVGSVIAEEESVDVVGSGGGDLEKAKGLDEIDRKLTMRRGRQIVKRSNIVAKQVISIQSALSLGFVSQLWVDTTTWIVMLVEVKPNLLSGESERFLLEDICQIRLIAYERTELSPMLIGEVGDVVLVENENVIENPMKMFGLDTLVGYEVVTPARQTIGKVRGYTFNINSGIVESLELDSFGISIIPSSLVSTYALFVEDVLEVAADRVVVHEAAASRIQRLTKGFWNTQKIRTSADEYEQLYDDEKPIEDRKTRRRFRRRKPRTEETEDDWDLPMDFS